MKKQSIIILVFTVIASLLLTVNLSVMVASADDNDSPTASGTETDRSLEEEQSGLISDHETITAMIRSFIQENQFADAAVCEDSLSGTVVISYYYVHPEQKKAFETFIKENAIDANEITILVMESAIEPKNDDTAVRFELDGNSISGYEGNTEGFMVYGVVDDGAIEYRIADESIAQIEYVDNKQVSILYLAPGSTVLTATTSDGKTVLELEVVVWPIEKEPVSEMLVNELYFNSQYGYVPVEIGLNSGISLAGYDDGIFYEVGESPIEFTIDDEQIAEIGLVQGIGVNVFGVSAGETTLHAKAPDGRTASIKVVVTEAPPVSTTARNEAATSADPGDVNMDGKVNSADARLALRASAKLAELSVEQKQSADINKDGKVNSSDARTILRIAAKLETVSEDLPEYNLVTKLKNDGCWVHLDLVSGVFSISGCAYQSFSIFGTFERKGNDLYLYPENASTEFYVLHREGDHFVSQSDENGVQLKEGLTFYADNDAFWKILLD